MGTKQPFSIDGTLDEAIAQEIKDGKWSFTHGGREMGSWFVAIYSDDPNRFYGKVLWSDRKNERMDGTRLGHSKRECCTLSEVPESIMQAVEFAVTNITKTQRYAYSLEKAQYNVQS